VFLASSINHHICFTKLIISDAYLHFIETAQFPDEEKIKLDPKWSQPVMERTIWYDLMSPAERAEAFRAIWSLAAWLSEFPATKVNETVQ
jgi:hypothetical protein